jgi:FKBP-type peptidyl-prolyl cis-trans isomerase SlyD
MLIERDKVVTFHYRLRGAGGEVLEDTYGTEPMIYLHGHRGVLKGLEDALAGKQPGDHLVVTLTPDQAYGQRDEEARQRISKSHVAGASGKKINYRPGMVVHVNTRDGLRPVTVLKVGLTTLDVDINHPLAGETLTFDLEIVDVREASEEELAHGHVHRGGEHH